MRISRYGGSPGAGLKPPTASHTAWTPSILLSFGGSAGVEPFGGLLADNGKLYGTTEQGGTYGYGVVYELSPPAAVGNPWTEKVYSFGGGVGGDGALPLGDIVIESGSIYGVTGLGGSTGCGGSGCGAIFAIGVSVLQTP